MQTPIKLLQGQQVNLVQVTGNASISGYVDIDLYCHTLDGPIKINVEAYVVKNMSTPLMLGNDFVDQYSISVIPNEECQWITLFHCHSWMKVDTHLNSMFWIFQLNLPTKGIKGLSAKLNSGNMTGIYDPLLKLLFPLKRTLQYLFSPISLPAQTAYMLRRSSQLIGMLMTFMHLPTLWFLSKILICTLQIFLPLPSRFRLAKYSEKDATWIPGLTAWKNTPPRTSRRFMRTLK